MADWQIAAILNIGQRAKHPLFVTNVDDTRLDDIAAHDLSRAGGRSGARGTARYALDNTAPAVDGIDSSGLQNKIDVIVQALCGAKNR